MYLQVEALLTAFEGLAPELPTRDVWKKLCFRAFLDSSLGKSFFSWTFIVKKEEVRTEKYLRVQGLFFHPGLEVSDFKDKDAFIYTASTTSSYEKLGVFLLQPFLDSLEKFSEGNNGKNLKRFILEHYEMAFDLLTYLTSYIESKLKTLNYTQNERYLELKRLRREFDAREKNTLRLYSLAFASAEFMDCSGEEPIISKVSPDSFQPMHQEIISNTPNLKMDGKPLFNLQLYSESYFKTEIAKLETSPSSPLRIDSLGVLKELCCDVLGWFTRENNRIAGGAGGGGSGGGGGGGGSGRPRSQSRRQNQRDASPDLQQPAAKRQSTGDYVRTTCTWNHVSDKRCAANFKEKDVIIRCECTGGAECKCAKSHSGKRCHQAYHEDHVPAGSSATGFFWCLPCRTGHVYPTN